MSYRIESDRAGNVKITDPDENSHSICWREAEKLGAEIKKQAFNARYIRKGPKATLAFKVFALLAAVFGATYLTAIPYFLVNSGDPELFSARDAAFGLLSIGLAVLSLGFENHLPRLSNVLVVVALVITVVVWRSGALSEKELERKKDEVAFYAQYCEEKDLPTIKRALRRGVLPVCALPSPEEYLLLPVK